MIVRFSIMCLLIFSPLYATSPNTVISFDQYKALVKHIQKENKYEGLIHVVPTARAQYEQKVTERPQEFEAYGPHIQNALKDVLNESRSAMNAEELSKDSRANDPSPMLEQHKMSVRHALKELSLERKIKHIEAYPETSIEELTVELEQLKKQRPNIPIESSTEQNKDDSDPADIHPDPS